MSGGCRPRKSQNSTPSVKIGDGDDPFKKRSVAKRPDLNDLNFLASLEAHVAAAEAVEQAAKAVLDASKTTPK